MSRSVKANLLDWLGRKEKGSVQKTAMYSGFFSSLTDNVMCTNSMYDLLMREIESSLTLFSADAKIELTVYESSETADETVRRSVLVGFGKYLDKLIKRARSRLQIHFITFFATFLAGVLLEYLLYGCFPGVLPEWISNVLDIVAWVFVWQFAAYITFEFAKELSDLKRLKQIGDIRFSFRHWE